MAFRLLSLLSVVAVTEAARMTKRSRSGPMLKFRAGQQGFKILQIADTQVRSFATDSCTNVAFSHWRYAGCNAYTTTKFIQRLLEDESPDLVVFTGDNINGSPDGEETHRLLFDPVIASGIPFAAVFGNHDEEGNMNRQQMMDWISSQPNSLAVAGPEFESDHIGNYLLQIAGSNSSTAAFNLWFIDSGDYARCSGCGTYDWIQVDQIEWYRQQSEQSEQAAGHKLDSIAFFHIPTPEWRDAAGGLIVGERHEGVYAPNFNSGLMSVMQGRGDVRAATVGHDHVNDWCGVWQGMDLCYGGGAGYTTYGRTGWDRRARVFMIYENGTIETWKRLDDQGFSKIDQQELNGTTQGTPNPNEPEDPLPDYRGTQSVTRSGKTCQEWTSQSPHAHSRTPANYPSSGLGAHNQCRNPDGDSTIWCYTLDPDSRFEYCDPSGLDEQQVGYRGTQSVTQSGRTCQKWTAQSPHSHTLTPGNFPAYGLGDHNYCRNPDGEPRAWCYTTDSGTRWEYCDVQEEAAASAAAGREGPECDLPAKPSSGRRPDHCRQQGLASDPKSSSAL